MQGRISYREAQGPSTELPALISISVREKHPADSSPLEMKVTLK